MRAIWKGAVAFGLVNVPVKLYAATGEHEVTLHQVHIEDGGRIRYRRVCSVCGQEVTMADIAKGYQADDGTMVVLTDDDLAELPLATGREIDVLEFVPAEQVDPILLARTYYLEPERTAAKAYTLLREALAATERMAVVKVALRQRESMAVLRVRDNVICLQTLLWPDEVRAVEFPILDADVTLRPQELAMASSLIESMAADFDPSEFEDSYATALEALIDAKLEAGTTVSVPTPASEAPAEGGEIIDLLAALQRSVETARASRGVAEGSTAQAGEGSAGADEAAADRAQPEAAEKRAAQADGAGEAGSEPEKKKASRAASSKGASSKPAKGEAAKGEAAKGEAAKPEAPAAEKKPAARRRAS